MNLSVASSRIFSWSVFGAGALLLATIIAAQEHSPSRSEDVAAEEAVRRGRYLVHHVAQCIQCHTPRDPQGNLLPDRLLQGAVIPLASPYPGGDWATQSAWIAGLENYEEETVVYLLQHGRRPDGQVPRPPMPAFHMTEEDARAVVAYLASLRPVSP